jgi:23S rRNA (pseudouridine1915-N3)-methyltransferase
LKVTVLAVGRPGRLFAEAITEYERRAQRYWNLEVIEIREERAGRGKADSQIRSAESARILERVPAGAEVLALTRQGAPWSSIQLARHLETLAIEAMPGAAFLIGGALGVAEEYIVGADRRLSLSPLTLPHELARLLLIEQIYRAGTIVRGEPYHKIGGSGG